MGRTAKSQSPRRGRSANKAPRKAKSQSPRRRTSKSAAASKGKPRSSLKPVAFNKLSLADQDFIVNQLKPQKCLPGVSCRNEEVFCNKTLKPIIRRVLKIDPKNLTRDQMCDLLFEYRKLNQEIISAKQKQSNLRVRLREKEEEREDLKRAKCRIAAQKNKDIRALNDQIAQLEKDKRKLASELKRNAGDKEKVQKLSESLARREKVIRELRAERKKFIETPTVNEVALKHAEKQLENREKEIQSVSKEEDHVRKEIVYIDAKKKQLEQEAEPTKNELISKEAELNEIERNRYALEERLAQLEREMEEKEVELRVAQFDKEQRPSKQQELRDEIERKKKILRILKAKRDQQDPEYYILHINRLEKVIRDKNNVIEESERRIKEIEKVFENQEKLAVEVVMDLKQELENAFRVRNNARSKLLAVETELESIRSENFSLNDRVRELETEVRRLGREAEKVAHLEKQASDAQQALIDVDVLRAELGRCETELTKLDKAKTTVEREYKQLAEEDSRKSRRIADLEKQVGVLERNLSSLQEEKNKIVNEKSALESKRIKILGSFYSISSNAGITQIQNEIEKLEAKIKENEEEEKRLINELGPIYEQAKKDPKKYGIMDSVSMNTIIRELSYRNSVISILENMINDIVSGSTEEDTVKVLIKVGKQASRDDANNASIDSIYSSDPYYSEEPYGSDPLEEGSKLSEKLMRMAKSIPDSSVSTVADTDLTPLGASKDNVQRILNDKDNKNKVSNLSSQISTILRDKVKLSELISKAASSSDAKVKEMETNLGKANSTIESLTGALTAKEAELAAAKEAAEKAPPTLLAPKPVANPLQNCDNEIRELKSEIAKHSELEKVYLKKIDFILQRHKDNRIRANVVRNKVNNLIDDGTFGKLKSQFEKFKDDSIAMKDIENLLKLEGKSNVTQQDCEKITSRISDLRNITGFMDRKTEDLILSLFEDVAGIGRVYIRMFGKKIKGGIKEVAIPQLDINGTTIDGDSIIVEQDFGGNPQFYRFGPFTKVFHNDYKTKNDRNGTSPRPTNNTSIYEDSIKTAVENNIDLENPYNIVLLVYGQSGSGKTYTLNGDSTDDPGIMYATLETLINKCDQKGLCPKIEVAFVQFFLDYTTVTNADFGDRADFFLTPSMNDHSNTTFKNKALKLEYNRNNPNQYDGVSFSNIFTDNNRLIVDTNNFQYKYETKTTSEKDFFTSISYTDFKDLSEKVKRAIDNASYMRPTRGTDANSDSSRSHLFSIFKITLGEKSFVLTFIDLGGNEDTSTKKGHPAYEGNMINTSLIGIRSYLQRYGEGFTKEQLMTAKEEEDPIQNSNLNYKIKLYGEKTNPLPKNINNIDTIVNDFFNGDAIKGVNVKSRRNVAKIFLMMNKVVEIDRQTQDNRTKVALYLHIRSHTTGDKNVNKVINDTTGLSVSNAVTQSRPAPGTLQLGSMILNETPEGPKKSAKEFDIRVSTDTGAGTSAPPTRPGAPKPKGG